MTFEVIFISGIHGVGKGTLGEKLSSHYGFPIYSASNLIKKEKNAEVDKNKVVIDADKNQDHLISSLSKLNITSKYIFLDGHFCLQGDKGVIEIPLNTFKGIKLSAVVLLVDDPSEISKRLHSRDNSALNSEVLHILQESEINHAEFVVGKLSIPMIKTSINSSKKIIDWLDSILAIDTD